MYPNINSGLGKLMAETLINNAAQAGSVGRFFLVFPSSLTNASELKAMYSNYADGVSVTYTTLALASAACVAGRGDVIYLMPGHTESISSPTALNLSIAGVTVIALGQGGNRAIITLDTGNDSTITVSASNITIKNTVFVANFLAVAACFTLTTAKDFQLINCEFRDTDATHNFIAYVVLSATSNANDGLLLDNNRINSVATSGAVKLVSFLGTINRVTIQNNKYLSLTTNAGAVMPIAAGKAVTDLYFLGNLVNVQNAAGTATGYLITANTAGTGFIHNNYFFALPTTPLLVTAGRGFVYGLNYHADQADLSGYLLPAADV